MKKILYFFIILLSTGVFTACRKKNNTIPVLDQVRDSIYYYTKETYYWNDAIPDYNTFGPRNFSGSSDLNAVTNEVNALSQYKINPANGLPYEYNATYPGQAKYSFIDNGQTSTALGGSRADFGFAVTAKSNTDLRVRYVYPGSPAGLGNLHRGESIVKINGRTGLDIGINADYNFVINALGTSPINLTLRKADNSTYDVTITSVNYTANPVLTYKVFDQGGGKKVGYVVYNSFTAPANSQAKLDEAFNFFTANGITDLVVDLRYNGGGYVSMAEYLSNLIVPASKTGTLMYNTFFNSILTSGKAELLKNQVRKDANGSYNMAQIDFSPSAWAVNFSKKVRLMYRACFL